MKKLSLVALLSIAMLFFITSCGQNTDRENEFEMDDQTTMEEQTTIEENKFWTTDRDYTFEQRDQFKQDVDIALAKLNSEIMALENEAANATGKTKELYNEKISNLKEQRDAINTELQEFANANEDNWEDFKDGIASAWQDIEDSYEQFARETQTDRDAIY